VPWYCHGCSSTIGHHTNTQGPSAGLDDRSVHCSGMTKYTKVVLMLPVLAWYVLHRPLHAAHNILPIDHSPMSSRSPSLCTAMPAGQCSPLSVPATATTPSLAACACCSPPFTEAPLPGLSIAVPPWRSTWQLRTPESSDAAIAVQKPSAPQTRLDVWTRVLTEC
jgi:hypothetical protein